MHGCQVKGWVRACTYTLICFAQMICRVMLHRYPVHYARDVPEGEPQRVWLFDEPIVIARRPGNLDDLGCSHEQSCSIGANNKPASIIHVFTMSSVWACQVKQLQC